MMTPKDSHLQKRMDLISKLNLSRERMDAIEAYLKDEAALDTLESFPFVDLSGVNGSEFSTFIYNELNKGRDVEAGKLFNVLFSIGQSTCFSMVANDFRNQKELPGVEQAKLLVVYAEFMGNNSWCLTGHGINNILERSKGDPNVLLKAISYSRQKSCNGRLILMACYFLKKYANQGGAVSGDPEPSRGLFSGIGKLLTPKKEDTLLTGEDQKLLRQYESIIVDNFDQIISNQNSPEVVKEIRRSIQENKVDGIVLRCASKCAIQSDFLRCLLGGLAYLNYRISPVLKNAVRVLLAVDAQGTLNAMERISRSIRIGDIDICLYGREYDREFDLAPEKLIDWAARESHKPILKAQFGSNREAFLEAMDKMDFEKSNTMLEIIHEKNPALYEEILASRRQSEDNQDRERLINNIVPKGGGPVQDLLRDYLKGKQPVTSIYPYADQMGSRWGYGNLERELEIYCRHYEDEPFIRRCLIYMAVRGCDYFFTAYLRDRGNINCEKTVKLFEGFEREGVDLLHQVNIAAMIHDAIYSEDSKEQFFSCLDCVFRKYLQEKTEETVGAFRDGCATGRYFGLLIYGKEPGKYKSQILMFSQDSSKLVREQLLTVLYRQPDWEQEILGFLVSKKAAERELAIQTLAHWDNGGGTYAGILREALEKEKNAKVRSLLESVLKLEEKGADAGTAISCSDLVKNLHKGGKKRSLAWAYENRAPFSVVHKKDGSEATEEYLQAILLCYVSMNPCGVNPSAKALAEELNESELALYVNELFDRWMEDGAEAKKRWVLYAAAIHGGSDIVEKLRHQINEWPQNARGAIAGEAVQALALNPLPQALLIVDGISRKFKFKQVKEAAGKALDYAAAQLGLTTEELADKIVPDLGFDENMERRFDYGERIFTVTITTALEIEIFDEAGKKLKSLPAPGKKDDEEKAKAAYEEFKQLKKQLKTTVSSQKMRLELALSAQRQWTAQAWKDLFVKNPVMHQFAIGLIWGIYEEEKLVQTFRYMEDGSFNTEDEEEYEMPDRGKVGLVHPIELDKNSIDAWKQQLEDYEITQPIEQLGREIFRITEEERGSKRMERFGGYVMNALSLGGKLQTLGWYRGSVQDAGGFDTYYREDPGIGLGAELHFSGSFVGAGYEDEITVYDVRFYKAGSIQRGSYVYDEADDKKALLLGEIPERYFSEIVLQMKKATASSQERNENWKKSVDR